MRSTGSDRYSPREVALAAGVPEADVVAALGGGHGLVGRADAVRIGRMLVGRRSSVISRQSGTLFSVFSGAEPAASALASAFFAMTTKKVTIALKTKPIMASRLMMPAFIPCAIGASDAP